MIPALITVAGRSSPSASLATTATTTSWGRRLLTGKLVLGDREGVAQDPSRSFQTGDLARIGSHRCIRRSVGLRASKVSTLCSCVLTRRNVSAGRLSTSSAAATESRRLLAFGNRLVGVALDCVPLPFQILGQMQEAELRGVVRVAGDQDRVAAGEAFGSLLKVFLGHVFQSLQGVGPSLLVGHRVLLSARYFPPSDAAHAGTHLVHNAENKKPPEQCAPTVFVTLSFFRSGGPDSNRRHSAWKALYPVLTRPA